MGASCCCWRSTRSTHRRRPRISSAGPAGCADRYGAARALLKNPPILILDEATSALDSESERLIQRALKTLLQGRTAFVIAHRLSTVRDADRIVVIKDGEIAEVGNHAELLAQGGYYASLVARQTEGIPEESEQGGLVLFQRREGRHVGQPEPGQPALLIHLDVEVVGRADHLDRAPGSDLQVKDTLRAVGLHRERGVHLD